MDREQVMVSLLVREALEINRGCASRDEPFVGFGLRDEAALRSAIGAVFQSVIGQPAYPDVYSRGAALLIKVAKAHAFVDGNKRTAFLLCVTYLGIGEISISPQSPQEAIDFVERVTKSDVDQGDLIRIAASQLLEWS